MIAQKHHGLFAVAVHDIHQLFCQLGNFALLKFYKVAKFLGRDAEGRVVVTLVNDIFRAEGIACPLFKLL